MTPNDADEGALAPDEVVIESKLDDHRIDELGENRFVVRPERPPIPGTLEDAPVSDEADGESELHGAERGTDADDIDIADYEGALDSEQSTGPPTLPATTVKSAEPTDVPTGSEHGESKSRLEDSSDPHGVDLTLKTDGELAHLHATSHDIREVFSELLTWYATQLDDDLSPAETLRIMLATTEFDD